MQTDILSDVPAHASFLFCDLRPGQDPAALVAALGASPHPAQLVVGLGARLLAALRVSLPGMRPMPALVSPSVSTPVTPADVFFRVSGADPGEVLHRERALLASLPALAVTDRVDGFSHRGGRDLSGFEDGTENPVGDAALRAAMQHGVGPGIDGSSVVAVQRWLHDLDALQRMSLAQQNHTIGRDLHSNEELEDAPESAHIKRTAQEDFTPEAFVLRRSMPWRDVRGAGLVFLSFSATLDPFEAQLRRMVGLDDGIVDALFSFTRPVTGGVWWCPPVREGRLDLRACGVDGAR